MLNLTCIMISSVDLAHYGAPRVKIGYLWVVVKFKVSIIFIDNSEILLGYCTAINTCLS